MGRSMARATALPRSPQRSPPSAPPPLIHALSPYARIPLPPTVLGNITLNPILEVNRIPSVQYNITLPPHFVLFSGSGSQDQETWLRSPATDPLMTSLTIRSSALDRPIVVRPSNSRFVTVWDILSAIHNALREDALRLIYSPPMRGPYIWQTPSQLPFHLGANAESAVRETMSALLAGRCWWRGLTSSQTEDEVWILHTG